MTLQYILQEGRDKKRSFMNRARKLRDSVYTVQKKEAQFKSRRFNSLEIASEQQAYEGQKRNHPGG